MMWSAVAFVLALAINQVLSEQVIPGFVEGIDDREAWDARIVSGWEAYPGQHPHIASLRMVNRLGSVQACGGSIVSRQWVISAAHCTATQITILVRAGVTDLTRPEIFTETQEYYMYPTYNPTNPGVVQPDDIAIVKLQISLTYSQNLKPIRIQSSVEAHRNYDNLIVHASGFGRTWTNGPTPEVLRWVYLRGVSNVACTNVFTSQFVTDNTICARFFNVTSQSICQGDSGGPLVHVSSDHVPILVGVSSFVAAAPLGCHSGIPGAFIRPGPFHPWFTKITGIDFEDLKEDEITTTSTTPTTAAPTTTASTTTTSIPSTTTFTPSTTRRITSTTTSIPSTTTFSPSTTSIPSTTTSIPSTTTFSPSTTRIPSTTTSIPSTITFSPSTSNIPSTTTSIPSTATFSPSTTRLIPSTTTSIPSTTTFSPSTITSIPSTTTSLAPTTPTTPAPEEEEDDPELEDLLKRLEVRVKVKVRLSKYLKRGNK